MHMDDIFNELTWGGGSEVPGGTPLSKYARINEDGFCPRSCFGLMSGFPLFIVDSALSCLIAAD